MRIYIIRSLSTVGDEPEKTRFSRNNAIFFQNLRIIICFLFTNRPISVIINTIKMRGGGSRVGGIEIFV